MPELFSCIIYQTLERKKKVNKILAIVVTVVVVAAVVGGFMLSGSPKEARLENADLTRVDNLQQIASSVRGYYAVNKTLPVDLAVITDEPGYFPSELKDPLTGADYEYRVVDAQSFELCATFDTNSNTKETAVRIPVPQDKGGEINLNFHDTGKNCFTLSAQ